MRSASASSTVRTRVGERLANEALWSEVKQTTSQRPTPGRSGVNGVTSPGASTTWPLSDGNRFSKTTTS